MIPHWDVPKEENMQCDPDSRYPSPYSPHPPGEPKGATRTYSGSCFYVAEQTKRDKHSSVCKQKQITRPGGMHETWARTWCSGRTWRERVGREVGGGIGMGKTCEPKAFSFQCMTEFTEIKKNNNNNKKVWGFWGKPEMKLTNASNGRGVELHTS